MFCEFVLKAVEKQKEEVLFAQWCVQLPVQSVLSLLGRKTEYVSFEAYKNQGSGANIDMRSNEDMLSEIEEIEKKFMKGGD